jgi:hypothetical protein
MCIHRLLRLRRRDRRGVNLFHFPLRRRKMKINLPNAGINTKNILSVLCVSNDPDKSGEWAVCSLEYEIPGSNGFFMLKNTGH